MPTDDSIHYAAPETVFRARCGADVPNQRTTTIGANVTCAACLRCQHAGSLSLFTRDRVLAIVASREPDTKPDAEWCSRCGALFVNGRWEEPTHPTE